MTIIAWFSRHTYILISPIASKLNTHISHRKVLFSICVWSLGTCRILSPGLWLHVYCFTWGNCLLPTCIWHGCALCWSKAVLFCLVPNVPLLSSCAAILFCHHDTAFPLLCICVNIMLLCQCWIVFTLTYMLLLWCCAYFATVVLLCFCHAVLPLSCCFASILLLYHCNVALFLSCCFACAMLLCLCHAALPLSCCYTPVILHGQHIELAIVGLLDSTLLHVEVVLSLCVAIITLPSHSEAPQGPEYLVHQMLTVLMTINPEKQPTVGSRPGSILTGSGSHRRFFSGLIVIGTVNIWCTKQSGPYVYFYLTLASGHRPWMHCQWFVIECPSMQ